VSRPYRRRVSTSDVLTVVIVLAPWVLAAVRARRAVAAAPVQAVAWWQLANGCRATALQVGRLGVHAEAQYWKVVGNGR
jgi:hypothetical protein